jgi:DNA polymerase alpha subunit A
MECAANGLGSVGVAKEQPTPPPLTILSLSIKTILNAVTRTNEILCIGALIHPECSLDKPLPMNNLFKSDFCVIRSPPDRHMPARLQETMETAKRLKVEVTSSERSLLAYFLAKLGKIDPDIIIGHGLSSVGLETLQHRMSSCMVPSWSRIGRLKKMKMPKGRSIAYSLCCGRLLCDMKVSAQELIRCRSYDLRELVNSILHSNYQPMDNEDIARAFGTLERTCDLISHTMNECLFHLQLSRELCVLPLAYQITCISGNILSRTLSGGRAQRNEFLLLHAFHQRGFIVPDKGDSKKKITMEGDEEGDGGKRGKGPSYAGGLVLEPKVGFYDRLILLLDFNSLYPSIIQEYNICFTTVDHAHCHTDKDFEQLQLPDSSESQGVLPSEIRVLVERRKKVKSLMKGNISQEMYQQYDIRQKALKLTANSMYGCLGFVHSRFYAKPLAALVTSKGRQILEHTRNLTIKLGLNVIYGDTDSIMIDSGVRELEKAEELARKVKTEVNKIYQLLEIDVDGIFKCLLLLKKKKYAAIALHHNGRELVEKRELKGLDIVRRDWCDLAKNAGHAVLDEILKGQELDKMIENIQKYLNGVSDDITNGRINLRDYVINKSLTKHPKDYSDKKSQPHVQVAMRMISRQELVQSGDVIPYIICVQGDGDGNNLSAIQRAFHPSEVVQQSLQVDVTYYLQNQLHPVISRLCEPIDGLDSAHLAQWVGLDPRAYTPQVTQDTKDSSVFKEPDEFDKAHPFNVICSKCHFNQSINRKANFQCKQCRVKFDDVMIFNSLKISINYYIKLYYQGWLGCSQCNYRTRSFINMCVNCSNPLTSEYTSADLHNQLRYFKEIFTDHANCVQLIDKSYIDNSLYTTVNLGELFPKLKLK